MSDSESFSSDDVEFFPTDFPESIPEDSDSSDGEDDDFYSYDISSSTLTLDVGLTFSSWKIAFQHIKQWAHQQGFFVRKGRSEKVQSERRKQTIVCHCEGVPNIKPNKQTKSCRTNCKWHVNLSRPIKNNPDSLIFVTTLLNEHSGHNLDVSACHFEASKAFTKPMLKDIEWMSIHGHLKPLAIKRMLKAKYNRKVYNQDLYKVIYKYRHNNDTHGNDVSRVFEYLEKYIQTTSRSESVNGTFKRLLHNSNSTLVDILLAVEERLEEEQDNQDYVNWHNTLSITQSTTIASNAFSDIISELKEFTTFPIQKIHYNEMELAFSYDAKLLDRSCIINEDLKDWSFSSDFIEKQEIRQVTFQNLLSSCNETTIKCLWGVSYLTSSEVHHLVILLNNGTYKCSCMSLVTRGMICRHYFSVMLRTSDAQFHIGFLNQRWFISNQLDFRKQPFYPAKKFKSESNAQFLALSNTISDFSNSTDEVSKLNINQYASLKEQHLYYVNVRGLTNQAKQIACKSCDESFITLLEEYIDKKNREAINLQHIDVYSGQHQIIDEEVDQENDRTIGNPIIRRPKGRPPGTARFKGPLQTSTQSNEVLTGRKCSLCNRNGHNRATCPMNPN
ncbi:unnamed protein product [Rhizophagus irregularis]|nr:unnamed protein product [Rhizophagus irregularis]